MEELDELSFNLLNEVSSNSRSLAELNKVAKNKINIIKEEHNKQVLVMNVSKRIYKST